MDEGKSGFKKFIAHFSKGWVIALLVIAVLLIAIRIALPPVATKVANDYLGNELPGYTGHVDGIHFSFFRGAYQVEGIYLDKIDSATHKQTEFVAVNNIDLSLEWSALFQGKIVGKLFFDSPVIKFTKDRVEPAQVVKDTTTFKQLLDIGMPLDVNRVEVENGQVHYRDLTSSPLVDISMNNIYVLAQNLRNTTDPLQQLPSSIEVNASVYGGKVDVKMYLDLLADDPTFDLKAEVTHLNLPGLNAFFKAYGKFTVEKGDFSVYSEMAAKDGGFKGYVKPIIKDMRILGAGGKDQNILTKLWEGILDAVNWVLKNKKEDQLATKIPIEGRFNDPKPNIWYTIFALLRNGWIQALNPALDYEININSVGAKDTRSPLEKFRDKRKESKENRALVKKENEAAGDKKTNKKLTPWQQKRKDKAAAKAKEQ
jgi:hypothetical protein